MRAAEEREQRGEEEGACEWAFFFRSSVTLSQALEQPDGKGRRVSWESPC